MSATETAPVLSHNFHKDARLIEASSLNALLGLSLIDRSRAELSLIALGAHSSDSIALRTEAIALAEAGHWRTAAHIFRLALRAAAEAV